MFHFSRLFTICLALTFVLTFPFQATGAADDPITIAFVGDFTGVTKDYCLRAYEAAQLAVDEINESGGLLDRKVVLIKLDGGNDPKRHFQHISELGARKDVVAVLGGATSPAVLEASKAAKEQRIPYLVCVGNSQKIVVENGHDYVFLFEANSYMETRAFSIVVTLMPWRKFAWLGPDYVWGHEVFQYYQEHFKSLGTPIEWVAQAWHPLGGTDFVPFIKRIMDAQPETLVIASYGGDMVRIIEQAKPYGLFEKVSVFSLFLPKGTDDPIPENMWTIARAPFNYLAEKYPRTKKFVDRYHQRYQVYPHDFSICSYDSMLAWKAAVVKANTPDREDVAGALKGLSFESLRGESFIRAIDGQMNSPTYCGKTAIKPEYQFIVLDSIIEIPAEKIWQTETEILDARKKAE